MKDLRTSALFSAYLVNNQHSRLVVVFMDVYAYNIFIVMKSSINWNIYFEIFVSIEVLASTEQITSTSTLVDYVLYKYKALLANCLAHVSKRYLCILTGCP